MNREIKFRAWDKYRGKMFYNGFQLTVQNFLYEWRTIANPKKDSLVVMQYTGLKDVKGKEIYEGDVIRKGDEFGIVEWRGAGWVVRLPKWYEKLDSFAFPNQTDGAFRGEIIGNIWESPELLKS